MAKCETGGGRGKERVGGLRERCTHDRVTQKLPAAQPSALPGSRQRAGRGAGRLKTNVYIQPLTLFTFLSKRLTFLSKRNVHTIRQLYSNLKILIKK